MLSGEDCLELDEVYCLDSLFFYLVCVDDDPMEPACVGNGLMALDGVFHGLMDLD